MKNLKKLVRTELKEVHGGNAPVCEYGEIACRYPPADGYPAYWVCEPVEYGCRH